jgi:hypothetical protein
MFEDDNQEVETSEETQDEVELIEEEDESSEEETDFATKYEEEKARRIKAEEAIEKAKKKGKTAPAVQSNGLSTADIIALTRANIEDEDIDEVLDYARYRKISVAEALKSSVVKATLSERAEERKSAQAVYTGGGTRRAGGSVSDERLMADASKGNLPESEADLARLTILRMKNR